MKKLLMLIAVFMLGACTTKYILMDENGNPVEQGYYAQNGNRSQMVEDGVYLRDSNPARDASLAQSGFSDDILISEASGAPILPPEFADDSFVPEMMEAPVLSSSDVFVVKEGEDFVTYQYRNVRVDEISPLASLYCADVAFGGAPYLREVSMYHNGFMRATFDCVKVAI